MITKIFKEFMNVNDGTRHCSAHVYDGEPARCVYECLKCRNENPLKALEHENYELSKKLRIVEETDRLKKENEEMRKKLGL